MEPREACQGPAVPRWLDADTAARCLCMTRHAIYQSISRCQVPFVRDGPRVRFDRYTLDHWMQKGDKYGFAEARGASGTSG